MPVTREYRCKCGFTVVEEVNIKVDVKTRCPECGGVLKQNFGGQSFYQFNNPRAGAISNRFKASRHG